MVSKRELSLLPDESNSHSFLARVIKYSTTIGRYIIVFTELIVISAFISRFWLDRQNSDISETLRQQKAIIESTAEFEKEYLALQSRLNFIDLHYQNQSKYVDNIKSIVSAISTDVFFQQLTINPKTAQISLYSYQEDSLVNTIVNLSLSPVIKSIDIQKIEKKSKDSKYFVDLSLQFNPQNGKSTI